MSVQRFTIALQNRLFLRFHLLSPVADGLRGGWSSPDLRPLFRWDLSHDTSPFRLPKSSAVSILGHVLSPFPSTLNFLRTSINNVREVFGCWCSLFCQMFKASPRYSVESLRNCPGVNPVHASIVSGSLPGKDTKPKKRRTFHLLSPVKKIAGNRHVIS